MIWLRYSRNVNYENNEISYYYGYGGHNFSSFVSFQLFTKSGRLGEVRFCQLVLLNYLDAFNFPIFTKFKRQRYWNSMTIVWIVDNSAVVMRKCGIFDFLFLFLENSNMVDRTVLYNDRTVLFEDEENHDWNLKIFHDRTVLSRTEVSFTCQKCPFFF